MGLSFASILLLMSAWQSFAEVREIKSMHEIIQEIDADTLVIFDIDNTVIEPTGQFGSDQWYYFLVQNFKIDVKLSEHAAHAKAEPIWNLAQRFIKTQAVERQTPHIIKSLQGDKIQVMALTARSSQITQITQGQLFENGVDFQISAPRNSRLLEMGENISYDGGILFQGEGNDKGKTLVKFLKHMNLAPKKIVFIDDKEKNTSNINRALEEFGGVRHIEFRYAKTDEKVSQFNADFLN